MDGDSKSIQQDGQENRGAIKASTASQTAWALLGLMAAGEVDSEAVGRGVAFLEKAPRETPSKGAASMRHTCTHTRPNRRGRVILRRLIESPHAGSPRPHLTRAAENRVEKAATWLITDVGDSSMSETTPESVSEAERHAWNDAELGGTGFAPWKKYAHPQLGEVEIGGWRARFISRNPPPRFLEGEIR